MYVEVNDDGRLLLHRCLRAGDMGGGGGGGLRRRLMPEVPQWLDTTGMDSSCSGVSAGQETPTAAAKVPAWD